MYRCGAVFSRLSRPTSRAAEGVKPRSVNNGESSNGPPSQRKGKCLKGGCNSRGKFVCVCAWVAGMSEPGKVKSILSFRRNVKLIDTSYHLVGKGMQFIYLASINSSKLLASLF